MGKAFRESQFTGPENRSQCLCDSVLFFGVFSIRDCSTAIQYDLRLPLDGKPIRQRSSLCAVMLCQTLCFKDSGEEKRNGKKPRKDHSLEWRRDGSANEHYDERIISIII